MSVTLEDAIHVVLQMLEEGPGGGQEVIRLFLMLITMLQPIRALDLSPD